MIYDKKWKDSAEGELSSTLSTQTVKVMVIDQLRTCMLTNGRSLVNKLTELH